MLQEQTKKWQKDKKQTNKKKKLSNYIHCVQYIVCLLDPIKLLFKSMCWEFPGGQVVKDLALSLLWLGSRLWQRFDPWPGNLHRDHRLWV